MSAAKAYQNDTFPHTHADVTDQRDKARADRIEQEGAGQ